MLSIRIQDIRKEIAILEGIKRVMTCEEEDHEQSCASIKNKNQNQVQNQCAVDLGKVNAQLKKSGVAKKSYVPIVIKDYCETYWRLNVLISTIPKVLGFDKPFLHGHPEIELTNDDFEMDNHDLFLKEMYEIVFGEIEKILGARDTLKVSTFVTQKGHLELAIKKDANTNRRLGRWWLYRKNPVTEEMIREYRAFMDDLPKKTNKLDEDIQVLLEKTAQEALQKIKKVQHGQICERNKKIYDKQFIIESIRECRMELEQIVQGSSNA
jgi:hypothetical protein